MLLNSAAPHWHHHWGSGGGRGDESPTRVLRAACLPWPRTQGPRACQEGTGQVRVRAATPQKKAEQLLEQRGQSSVTKEGDLQIHWVTRKRGLSMNTMLLIG